MLGNFEKRQFADGEKVWLGHYRNLTNVLHWHFECELIRIAEGTAQIRIGSHSFLAQAGDAFLCTGEELHYIISAPGSRVDVAILAKSVAADITTRAALLSPKLDSSIPVPDYLERLRQVLDTKGPFYREALEAWARGMIVDIFRSSPIGVPKRNSSVYNDLISKINREFSFITFQDAVRHCGYSPAHFSKMFRALSGMNFSDYLNVVRVEHAIRMLRENPKTTVTSISRACGFSTIRNFNRVFKALTGYSPRALPEGYLPDSNLRIAAGGFDPTQDSSVLL